MVKTSRSRLVTGSGPLQKLLIIFIRVQIELKTQFKQGKAGLNLIASCLIMSRGSCSRRVSIVIKQSQVYQFFS